MARVECRAQSYTIEGARGQLPPEHRWPLLISMEIWETILLAFGGNAALLLILGYLGKSLLDKLIVQDTKRFESELKAKSDAAIEQFRNTLQLQAIEHQVRFSRLHDKRASVIAELYSHLVEALWEAESFLSPMQSAGDDDRKKKYDQAQDKLVELYRYFEKHRIYLPEEICTSLQDLIQNVRSKTIKFGVWVRYGDHLHSEDSRKQMMEAEDSAWQEFTNEAPVARRSLENEFRLLLGATTKALQRAIEDSQR
jgi:hypothetical protein